MIDLKNTEGVLNRSAMKRLMAGNGTTSCLHCHTPGGSEEWERAAEGDPDTICEEIYPAYDEEDVSGSWGACSGLQEA